MKKSLYIIPAIVLSLLSACGSEHENTDKSQSAASVTPIKVSTKEAGADSEGTLSILSGTIQAQDMATVSARMQGYVSSMNVAVGDKVKKGQALIRIENHEMPAKRAQVAAGLTEAEAALKNVQINYERMSSLWEQKSITRREWDDISAQYEMTKAKVEAARQMKREMDGVVALLTVKAPISGVLSSKSINLGDLVNPGVPLMTIEGASGYEVLTYVSESQINDMKTGMEMDCNIEVLDKAVKATVTEVSPSGIQTGGQYAIRASLALSPEQMKLVLPGMYCHVMADLPSARASKSCIKVEKSALVTRGQLTGVYTVSGQNTAMLRWVRMGRDFGNEVEIVSGLRYGEHYIVSDASLIKDGVAVSK